MKSDGKKLLVSLNMGASGSLLSEEMYVNRLSHKNLTQYKRNSCDVHSNNVNILAKVEITLEVQDVLITDELLVTREAILGDVILLNHLTFNK